MEYELTEDGQIQADFAQRAGQLLLQYELCTSHLLKKDRYEATLCIALLQSLLTQAAELLKEKSKGVDSGLRIFAKRSINKEPTLFGLEHGCVVQKWPSDRDLLYREVVECLRHAVSHPLRQLEGEYPTTGYTTWKSKSGSIEGFSFFQSPFVERGGKRISGRLKVRPDEQSGKTKLMEELMRWRSNYKVPGLEIAETSDGLLAIFQAGKLFVPVLQLNISVSSLRTFTLALSDLLSESLLNKQLNQGVPAAQE